MDEQCDATAVDSCILAVETRRGHLTGARYEHQLRYVMLSADLRDH
jgi:hypothetical protein